MITVNPTLTKTSSLADIGVSKLRPLNVKQERECLYDDVLNQRVISNNLKEENKRLKTKIAILERQLYRKERVIDGLVGSITPSNNRNSTFPSPSPMKEVAEED